VSLRVSWAYSFALLSSAKGLCVSFLSGENCCYGGRSTDASDGMDQFPGKSSLTIIP
jgi:hypothetical protein